MIRYHVPSQVVLVLMLFEVPLLRSSGFRWLLRSHCREKRDRQTWTDPKTVVCSRWSVQNT